MRKTLRQQVAKIENFGVCSGGAVVGKDGALPPVVVIAPLFDVDGVPRAPEQALASRAIEVNGSFVFIAHSHFVSVIHG